MTDDRRSALLDKIRALLAKAESTNFPEEAKAYQSKAQELMTRYAIAELEIADSPSNRDEIVHEILIVVGPYALSKGLILSAVAKANRCKVLFPNRLNKGYKLVTRPNFDPNIKGFFVREKIPTEGKPAGSGEFHLFGFASDVELVKIMFTSLLVQATGEMLDSELDRQISNVHGKTWRNSFLKGYANGLTKRLTVANERAAADYGPKTGLALIDKARQVDQAAAPLAGGKKAIGGSVSSQGYGQGKAAANRADVGNARLPNQPKALR